MTNKKLGDFGIKNESTEFEKETQTLGQFVGQTLRISNVEQKKLGSYDGIIFSLVNPVKDSEGAEWNKIHTTKSSLVQAFQGVKFNDGDVLEVQVVGGKGSKGKDWYDLKDV